MSDVGRMILKDNYRTDSRVSNFFGVVIDNIVQIIPDCLRDKHPVVGDDIFNCFSDIKGNGSRPSRLHRRGLCYNCILKCGKCVIVINVIPKYLGEFTEFSLERTILIGMTSTQSPNQ